MSDSRWLIVLINIAAMFTVIVVGWVARRRSFLTAETTGALSRFIVDIALPALVLSSMINTVDTAQLKANWFLPLLGGAIMIVGQVVGFLTMPLFAKREQWPTFTFLVATANWIYLPLPIATALYGPEGERAVILFNIGAQVVLWTALVAGLQRQKLSAESLKNLVLNPGLVATVGGILLALLFPDLRILAVRDTASPTALSAIARIFQTALVTVGSLTIPLSMVVIGAQLGGLRFGEHRPSRALAGVLLARLFIVPAATISLVLFLERCGIRIAEAPRVVAYLIAAMPVAVSCSMFTERFGGDTSFAARSIFYSTLLSAITVPLIFFLIQKAGV